MLLRVGRLSCAALIVRSPSGDESIGTAFHVGEGVYLTARHVLEGNKFLSIILSTDGWLFFDELTIHAATLSSLPGDVPIWRLSHPNPHIKRGPFFHNDPAIDVAAFVVGGIDPNTPSMALGFHYDDWISDSDWLLQTGVAFGYPPIPMSTRPIQLAATVEINAVVDIYRDQYVRFVVSGAPRGGFSGGPVFDNRGFVLGMITESLERSGSSEQGFFTALSIEALHDVLHQHEITPSKQNFPDVDDMNIEEYISKSYKEEISALTAKGGLLRSKTISE